VTARIAVLGLGEAGSEIARDLVAAGADVRGYDPTVPHVDGVEPRAPVPGKGLRTPMLVSGAAAGRCAEILAPLGAELTVQPGPVGEAISRKLLRSVFYKGLAAAVVEALAAADAAGCGEWLRGNIGAELAGFDHRTIDRLVDGTHRHARRRADEMAAATEQLAELGIRPRISAAARDVLVELRDAQAGHEEER
jgi:3-hydroxyisobutyrate dehydrogenase-like beta-hydroxyacid dehydrogenase